MDVRAWLDEVRRIPEYSGQLAHVEELPARPGCYEVPERPLPAPLERVLANKGITQLYSHQARALDAARDGQDWVVVTGTASGKTLCYHLPILETCWQDPQARALFLYPTKALAQDQLKGLQELTNSDPELAAQLRSGVYDGDTPTAQRRRIKAEANLVLSNPDMLHASIMPYHPKWSRFFAELRFVVIDEVHMYRGILGAHVSCVLRRLQRICRHYGSEPTFLATSATIANPCELTEQLIGRPAQLIDHDGSPRGAKYFALWNPEGGERDALARRSAQDDAVLLMAEAMQAGGQTLAFTRTRQAAELINRYLQQRLQQCHSPLARKVRAYRGGYLPNERRAIEQDLFSGQLRGVAATNALELGVDIGSLDVVLLVHYPGTFASVWQQAGRSGRRGDESLAVLIAGNDPIDQYLLRHPDYFFCQPPEHAVVDPHNPYVLARHLQAAAFELPLEVSGNPQGVDEFGETAGEIANALADGGTLSEIAGAYYCGAGNNPAQNISLRHMSDNTFSIVLLPARSGEHEPSTGQLSRTIRGEHRAFSPTGTRVAPGTAGEHQVIANVDAISAPELVYPEAIYLHHGETYFVRQLDLIGKVAYVDRCETDYYTQAVLESNVRITQPRDSRSLDLPADLGFGEVDVTWKTIAFKKIKFDTRENIGFGPVDIPAQNLPTTAFWLKPHEGVRKQLKDAGFRISEALCGLRNLAVVALPMLAMCDSRDVSGVVDSKNLGSAAAILYDRYPGGLGYCEKGFFQLESLLAICREMVQDCDCDEGCPSCVGLPNLRPAIHSDPDLTRGYPIPDKQATCQLLQLLLAPVGQSAPPRAG